MDSFFRAVAREFDKGEREEADSFPYRMYTVYGDTVTVFIKTDIFLIMH